MSRHGRRAAWWLPALLVLAGCGGEPDPFEGIALEARPALELRRLASGGEPGVETLTALIRPDLLDLDPTGGRERRLAGQGVEAHQQQGHQPEAEDHPADHAHGQAPPERTRLPGGDPGRQRPALWRAGG